MYNSSFNSVYNSQISIDKLNEQINNLEKIRNQLQNPVQPITQNFQLAPTNRDVIRYAGSIDEVQRDMVMGDTPYFSKDMSIVWIKNTKGEIKTYELTEIIPKDEKDIQIELLQSQLNELKGMIKSEQSITNDIGTEDATDTTGNDEQTRTTTKESKSSSVSRVSTSKKKQ